ncbi:ankyrin repeat protein [Hypoxylon crocopeplum]|nr:ankyrin repeat protein [Hypoxylon crocopeplum]
MEPVTIIGLIVSVVELLKTTKSVVKVIHNFKNGDKDLSTLSNDISAFTEALIGFDRILRSRRTIHRISGPVIENVLRHSTELIQDLEARLLQLSKSEFSTVRRAKWVRHKSSIAKLHTQLKEQNAMLHTFLAITQADTFLTMATNYPRFMLSESSTQMIAKVSTDDSAQGRKISLLQVPDTERRARRSSDNSLQTISTLSDSTSSYMERLSIMSSATSIESATTYSSVTSGSHLPDTLDSDKSSCNTALVGTTSYIRTGGQLISQDMYLMRQSCRYDCHCCCHEADSKRQEKRRGVMKNSTVQCSESRCRGYAGVKDQFADHSTSFRKALSHIMSTKSIKVRYDLRTYRIVPEGSEAMRHVKHGNLEKLKICIESGEATIWDTAQDGWSLLHTATYNRQLPIVRYLMELGADTEAADVGSRKPADLAVLKSIGQDATEVEQDIVDMFSRNDDVLQDFDFTPIHIAVLKLYNADDFEQPSLDKLIKVVDDANNAPANTNWGHWKLRFKGRSPLFAAIIEYFRSSAFEHPDGTKVIHNLLDRKDKKYHWTPLHWAASSGRLNEMRALIEHGADPLLLSNLGANILHAAAESKIDRGLRGALKIWKHCSDRLNINQTNKWAETPLHVASWCSAACVKLLLEAGADPGPQEENGQVPLHCAGLSEQSPDRREIVTLLCNTENNAHINTRDVDGRSPIFDFLDDPECVELLILHGARVGLTDTSGKNILHYSCLQGESRTLATILGLSEDDETRAAKSNDGNTPLMEALSMSHIDCAMMLLEFNDIGDTIGKDGWALVHYAAKIGDPELLEAIVKHPSFTQAARTLDGKRANIVAMEAGNWHGRIKHLIREHDYPHWTE